MPQYTNTYTHPDGTVTNTVLDTETNTQTITVTTAEGKVATGTLPGDNNGAPSSFARDIVKQLTDQGVPSDSLKPSAIIGGIRQTTADVVNQATNAQREANSTNTAVPSAPNPPAPSSNTTDPQVPKPTPKAESQTPAETAPAKVDLASDPNTNLGTEGQVAKTEDAPPNINPNSDPNTNIGKDAQVNSVTTPYGDDGTLNPGWTQDELGNTYYEGLPKPQEQPTAADDGTTDGVVSAGALDARQTDQVADDGTTGAIQDEINMQAAAKNARSTSGAAQDKFKKKEDWRVRLSLAPAAKYLYNTSRPGTGDILYPLKETDGVIFPYTPAISINYKANYEPTDITHSNYKLYFYRNSAVDDINITAEFTAQDNKEASYLLAVIHFFKSVTKMFYGQDGKEGPKNGTPPPLCYLSGLGAFQFDNHPLLIQNFSYSLPTDVDYVRTDSGSTWGGDNIGAFANKQNADKYIPGIGTVLGRLQGSKLQFGGMSKSPNFKSLGSDKSTYVPTKIQIQLSAVPVVSRNDISNTFSLAEYAKGTLLQGSKRNSGGIW